MGYELDSETPKGIRLTFIVQDSCQSLLMIIIYGYSWDGRESWTSEIQEDSIYLFGQRDTLYGVFSDQKIILSSTLDDRPTEYHFEQVDRKKLKAPDLLGFSWKVDIEGHSFDESTFQFSLSPNSSGTSFEPIDMGNMTAFEYEIPATSPIANDEEYGIVYLYQVRKNRVEGLFLPCTRR